MTDCSALPRISGEGWRIALVMVKKCVIGEVCFDRDIINCTTICLVNPSRGFWVIFAPYMKKHCLPGQHSFHVTPWCQMFCLKDGG